jgi:hypothetical protein
MDFDKCNLQTRKSLGDFQFYESRVLPFDDFLWWALVLLSHTIYHNEEFCNSCRSQHTARRGVCALVDRWLRKVP